MNTTTTTTTTAAVPTGPAKSSSPVPILRYAALVALMIVASLAGELMQPTDRLSERKAKIALEKQVPVAFGDWQLDNSIRPVVPDPTLQAMLDTLYSQTLARTYINREGQRVMLSIAYGSDQSNEATAVHRPEFCYSAQGFRVKVLSKETINVAGTSVPVARVMAQLGQRIEPITYWVTLDESATLPGIGRKLNQIKYGLRGEIPDGMLVRVSSLSANPEASFALQQQFLEQMYAAVPADMRSRYFGSTRVSEQAAPRPAPA